MKIEICMQDGLIYPPPSPEPKPEPPVTRLINDTEIQLTDFQLEQLYPFGALNRCETVGQLFAISGMRASWSIKKILGE